VKPEKIIKIEVLSNPFLAIDYIVFDDCPKSNQDYWGQLIPGCSTIFFNIAFPHGNIIKSEDKITRYRGVKEYLLGVQKL
jgi:hypothetical protein